jgi:hypothetical protein
MKIKNLNKKYFKNKDKLRIIQLMKILIFYRTENSERNLKKHLEYKMIKNLQTS